MADVPFAARKARALGRLVQLEEHTKAYRTSMLRIFSSKLSRPRDCRKYFRELLLAVCRLYVDYLLVAEDMFTLRRCSRPRGLGSAPRWSSAMLATAQSAGRARAQQEAILRERLLDRLASRTCWRFFEPKMPFAESIRLETVQDYLDSFTLHLPEIYHGTAEVERCGKAFRQTLKRDLLSELEVKLEHMAFHHISFVRIALQWASHETTWTD